MNNRREYSYKDIPSMLLENRIIMVQGEVNAQMAYEVTSCLHILNEDSRTKPIQMLIDSPGGSITSGLSIIDTMNFIDAPVYTICSGMAASMGAAILSCGEKGHRMILPNATVMIHQASSGSPRENIQDLRVSMQYTEALNTKLATMIAKNCGKTTEEYLNDTQRDHYMFAEEALAYGIVDEIIVSDKLKKSLSL